MLKLAYVGGLGLMAGPAATHLTPSDVAQTLRVHDRGTPGDTRDAFREQWRKHGAELVGDFDHLIGDGEIDGVVICAGKNGDDLRIIATLTRLLEARCQQRPFLLHLSTVSPAFADVARKFTAGHNIDYVNYPLTGGPFGASLGGADPKGMLILASGEQALYERLLPLLKKLGHPRYFGLEASAGSVTKLIGHSLVFNGLIGIASGTVIHGNYFNRQRLGGEAQNDFMGFLNGGAGGTRQWDVGMVKGVRDGVWDAGFSIHHAVVDAIYLVRLMLDLKLPRFAVESIVHTVLVFSFILDRFPDQPQATHAIAREMMQPQAKALDAFMFKHCPPGMELEEKLQACINSLPERVRESVLIAPSVEHFEAAMQG